VCVALSLSLSQPKKREKCVVKKSCEKARKAGKAEVGLQKNVEKHIFIAIHKLAQ
jgi:hypothetical protein